MSNAYTLVVKAGPYCCWGGRLNRTVLGGTLSTDLNEGSLRGFPGRSPGAGAPHHLER